MLDVFGVGADAESVYRAMLDHPMLDAVGIASEIGLSVERVKQELDALAELMLVTAAGPGDDRFRARPPDLALEMLIGREESAIRERRRRVIAARDKLPALVDSYVANRSRRDARGLLELLEDGGAAASRLFQLVRSAQVRVAYLVPGEAQLREEAEMAFRLNKDLLDRGLIVRSIMAEGAFAAARSSDQLRSQVEQGLQARWHPAPAAWIVIVDDTAAVNVRRDGEGAMVMHGCDLIAPLKALFDQTWHQARPIEARDLDPSGARGPDPRVRQVVSLLAQGHKDEAIARRLGLSPRTVRRLVSTAVAQLHADSRFQAGVLAVKMGWIT